MPSNPSANLGDIPNPLLNRVGDFLFLLLLPAVRFLFWQFIGMPSVHYRRLASAHGFVHFAG